MINCSKTKDTLLAVTMHEQGVPYWDDQADVEEMIIQDSKKSALGL